jgi:hypothetical protein
MGAAPLIVQRTLKFPQQFEVLDIGEDVLSQKLQAAVHVERLEERLF